MDNKYGYKVCYRELGKFKLKIHLITNSLQLAKWEIQYYETHRQTTIATNNIKEPTWYVIPIKKYVEYKKLWKGCPF